jgi:hypothetical protein
VWKVELIPTDPGNHQTEDRDEPWKNHQDYSQLIYFVATYHELEFVYCAWRDRQHFIAVKAPVYAVEEEHKISDRAEPLVGDEVRVSEHHEPPTAELNTQLRGNFPL